MCVVASMYAWQTCCHHVCSWLPVCCSNNSLLPHTSNSGSACRTACIMHCSFQLPADLSCHLIGDVSCVLARTADTEFSAVPKAIVLTKEHKALFPPERKRIEKAGGMVTNGRLQGKPSNHIGHTILHLYKRRFATATPGNRCTYLVAMPGTSTTCVCGSLWACTKPISGSGGDVFLCIYIGLAAHCSTHMQRASCSK